MESHAPTSKSAYWILALTILGSCAVLPGTARAGEEGDQPAIARDERISKEFYEDAEVLREEQKWSEAADAYWKALDADLLNYMAHVRYQETALKAGDAATEIVADYDDLLEGHPRNVYLLLHRHRLRPPEERLPLLESLAKVHPEISDIYLEIGRAQLALGEAKQAMKALEKAMALKSGDRPDVLLLLAEAEHGADKTDDAIKLLDDRVKANAEDFGARLALARLQLLTGAYEASAANAKTVIEQRPSYVSAFLVKGEALRARARRTTPSRPCRRPIARARRAIPSSSRWRTSRPSRRPRSPTRSRSSTTTRSIARAAESWRAFYGKAWALERLEKWDKAEEQYREVVSLQPASAVAVNSVGFCLFKQGRISEAQVQFKRAMDMDKTLVTAQRTTSGRVTTPRPSTPKPSRSTSAS